MRVEDRAGTVADGVNLDPPRMRRYQRMQLSADVVRTAVRRRGFRGAEFHAVPDGDSADCVDEVLDRAVGHVADDLAEAALPFARAVDEISDRRAEVCVPDEEDRIDAVLLPPPEIAVRFEE